jgi:hypothetical protein
LGITPETLPPTASRAHLAEQRTLHMMNVLARHLCRLPAELWVRHRRGRAFPQDADPVPRAALRRRSARTGALPLLRVGKQPYGILPAVGKRLAHGLCRGDRHRDLLGVLRPMWGWPAGCRR